MQRKSVKATKPGARRPLKSRGQAWAKALAAYLVRLKISPNNISLASLAFALGAGALFVWGSLDRPALLGAAFCIQLRLLCNLMDGMVALEGGLKQKDGELYNEVPDRLADWAILLGAGWALPQPWGPQLGWLAAILAILTAYVRVFGGSLGFKQDFRGPQAKPQRMALLTLACLACLFVQEHLRIQLLALALGLIAAGSLLTFVRRLWALREALWNA